MGFKLIFSNRSDETVSLKDILLLWCKIVVDMFFNVLKFMITYLNR